MSADQPIKPGDREELRNVVHNYPVFPGDTLSHQSADRCCRRGWIVRNAGGDWIPTAAGIMALSQIEKGAP